MLLARIVYNRRALPVLTNYRPNFCSECGEKIVRLRWRVWTSRRFCEKCAAHLRRTHWLQRACAVLGLVLFGMFIGRGWRREPQALVIQRTVTTTGPNSSSSPQPVTTADTYICGAKTKKGTPCSRRVHGPVRCWQHRDVSSIIPVILIK